MAQSIIRSKPIDALVIHHTVVPAQNSTQAATSAALNKNQYAYDGKPPYHYVIGNSWDYQTRPYNTVGYQAGSKYWNDVSIGIALTGNFQVDIPTAHQQKRLGEVIKELMRVYNIPRERVFLHKQVRPTPTACPGTFITQRFIDILLLDTMPTCEQQLEEAKRFDREERVPQIKRLQDESRTLTQKVRDLEQIVSDKDGTIAERDRILDEKRAIIVDLEKQIEQGGDNAEAAQKLIKAKEAWNTLVNTLT